MAIALLSTVSCSRSNAATTLLEKSNTVAQAGDITEVSPPDVIQSLRRKLEIYQPQVTIVSPEAEEVFEDDKVEVSLQIRDLPIFKNSELELGPHLHVILDNQPDIAVYDVTKPLVLQDLEPGTHTLRVFAARPWDESFKNAGAYAQTTFHVFTKTQNNNLDPALPLLTYSRPRGAYGAEPILLDFYLTNAPLRLATTENSAGDWRIRCTINGSSFVLDSWQSVYLKGFKPGKNWVQLEFIDSQGNSVKNVFNNTIRTIIYEPNSKDTLSQLVTGELSADAARGIVDQTYTTTMPLTLPTETLTPEPTPTESPTFELVPAPTETPTLTEPLTPEPLPLPSATPSPIAKPKNSSDTIQRLRSYFKRVPHTNIEIPNTSPTPEIRDPAVEKPPANLVPEIN